jgi:hypothetical protein
MIARRKRFFASGEAMARPTFVAPDDWPKIVIRSGSPPNAAIFAFTQRRAACWSSKP